MLHCAAEYLHENVFNKSWVGRESQARALGVLRVTPGTSQDHRSTIIY
jgi:hypothetical protein